MSKNFGYTVKELYKNGFKNIYEFINYDKYYQNDKALASTIYGFSRYVNELKPDLIVVHVDRIEPLSEVIVGALIIILVTYIECGGGDFRHY